MSSASIGKESRLGKAVSRQPSYSANGSPVVQLSLSPRPVSPLLMEEKEQHSPSIKRTAAGKSTVTAKTTKHSHHLSFSSSANSLSSYALSSSSVTSQHSAASSTRSSNIVHSSHSTVSSSAVSSSRSSQSSNSTSSGGTETTVYAHSFAASRMRRAQSIDASSAQLRMTIEATEQPTSPPPQQLPQPHSSSGERDSKTVTTTRSSVTSTSSASNSSLSATVGAGSVAMRRRGHSLSVSLSSTSPIPASIAVAPQTARSNQLSPAPLCPEPLSAPPRHRRSSTVHLSTPFTPPGRGSSSSSSCQTPNKRQKKPKAGPILNAPSSRLFLDVNDTPGVGAYRSYSQFSANGKKGVKMHERIQQKDPKAYIPAPGAYDGAHASSLGQSSGAAVSMDGQTGRREVFTAMGTQLGPGEYDNTSQVGIGKDGPAMAMHARVADPLELTSSKHITPGPASYDVKEDEGQGVSMKGSRGSLFARAGEGADVLYDVESSMGKGRSARLIGKSEVKDETDVPGVGEYDGAYASTLQSRGISAVGSKRPAVFDAAEGPAPGSYELKSSLGSGPAAAIRSRIEQRDVHAGGAAPGDYEAAHASTLAVTGGVGMSGQSSRSELFTSDSSAPAPGSYELKSSIGSGPAAAIRSRIEHKDDKLALPAVGQYDGAYQSTLSSQGAVGMDGQRSRSELFAADELAPAPGQYDIKSTIGQAPAASIRSRLEHKDAKADVPGPGQYEGAYTSTLGQTGAAVSMDGTVARSELFHVNTDTADVGAYELRSSMGQGPAASLRSRLEQRDVHAGGAAVGQYDGAYASTLGSSSSSAVSMDGQAGRSELFSLDAAAPAPGQYELASTIGTGRAAALRSRISLKDAHADVPAPGSYSGAYQSTLGQSASATMSLTSRGELFQLQSDGPDVGSYDIKSSLGDGPAASIRSRIEQKDGHAGGAAVGQYDGAYQSTLGGQSAAGHVSMAGQSSRSELFEASATPAPGSYEIKSRIGEGRVAAIRSRIEEKIAQASNPAPGAYDGAYRSTLASTGAAVAMGGQTGRAELFGTDAGVPAPGSYELKSSLGSGPAAAIRSRIEQRDVHAGGAAPGDYEAAHASTLAVTGGVGMSGQSSRSELFTSDSSAPAPGSYELKSSIGSGPAAAIRSRIEHKDDKLALPAVGQYDGAYQSTLSSQGAVGMDGQRSRSELFAADELAPAPGQYDIKSTIGQAPAASIRSRLEHKDAKADVPGPGQYEGAYTSTLGQTGAAVSMDGTVARSELFHVNTDTADVGAYELRSSMGQGPAASLRSRLEQRDVHAGGAAVGQYDGAYASTLGSSSSSAVSMDGQAGRSELFSLDAAAPAPGQYELASTIGTGRAAALRSRISLKDAHADVPAPGSYSGAYQSTLGQSASATMSLTSRGELFQLQSDGPDVGSYDIKSSLGDGPAASIRSRIEQKDGHAGGAAVGQYDGAYQSTLGGQSAAGHVSMAGQSSRSELFEASATPAPGSYEIKSRIGEGRVAAIRSRIEEKIAQASNPAPGAYDGAYRSTLASTGAAVAMGGQTGRAELFGTDAGVPAPGSYELKSSLGSGPAAAIRSRIEQRDVHAGGAAPGDYEAAHASTLAVTGGVGMSGQSSRSELFTSDSSAPAPGSYELKSSIGSGPAAAIRSRIEHKDDKLALPAVGQYDGAYQSTLRTDSGAVSMAASTARAELFTATSDAPAVGSYDIKSTIGQGPAAAIRSKIELKDDKAQLPAPGQYSIESTLGSEAAASNWKSYSGRSEQLFEYAETASAGPAAYDIQSTIGQGPAASIRSKIEVRDSRAANPAPGAYSGVYASTLHGGGTGAGAASMALSTGRKAELFDVGDSSLPAPGSYSLPSSIGVGPAASIRSRLEQADPLAANPGVGAYDVLSELGSDAPAVRMRGYSERKEELFDNTNTPSQGPAAYTLQSSMGKDGPAHSIAVKRESKDEREAFPGVGQYDGAYSAETMATAAASSAVRMDGQSARGELFTDSSDAPAPGSYSIASTIGQGPATAIRSRIEQRDVHAGGAAPGDYESAHTSTFASSSGVSMNSQSARAELFAPANTGPAPGAYEIRSTIGQGPAATVRGKVDVKDERANYPGVGEYNSHVSSLSSTSAVSMAGSSARAADLFTINRDAAPVGSYEIKSTIGQGPAAAIRSKIDVKDPKAALPSPGQYDSVYESTLGRGAAGSVSMQKASGRGELYESDENAPAPGQYQIPSSMGQGPAASIRSVIVLKDAKADNPAPGEYSGAHQSTIGAGRGSVLGGSMALASARGKELFDVGDSSLPAPGSYSLPSSIGVGPAASIRSRLEQADPLAANPGVGAYDVLSELGSDAPAVRMRGYSERKEELFDNTNTPSQGPAAYTLQSSMGKDGPAHSIAVKRESKDEREAFPGVGQYDGAYKAGTVGSSASGAVSLDGQSARGELFQVNHDTADVGAYEIASSIGTGPAASIRSRIEQRDVHAGGAAPGSYEAYQSSLSQTGAASMAGTARSELFHVNTDTADVGAYDIKSTIGQGPAASIRSRISQKDVHAGGVGVGQYDGAYASTLDSHGAVGMEQHVGRQELFAVDASAPAPGTYSIQSTLGQGPAASIRSRIDTRDVHAGGAAPGSYDAYQSSLSQTGAASMAGTARSELFQVNHDTADVGAYEIASSIGTGPAASIRSRIEQRDVHAGGAAPGSYEAYQSSLSQTGAASMAGTARSELFHVNTDTADVGAYDIKSTIGQGPAASIRSRISQKDVHAGGVGVGQYDGAYASTLDSHGAVGMEQHVGRQELFAVDASAPAPGTYSIQSTLGQGPAASIRSRIDTRDVHAGGAAPGSYDAYQSSLSQTGAASMAGTARSELFQVNHDTADVGAYEIASSIGTGPAASIRSRIEQRDVHAGGAAPGSYEAYQSSLSQTGAASMAGTARSELFHVNTDTADVGAYDIKSTIGQGPAASIRSRISQKDVHAGGVGVGQYDGAYASTLDSHGAVGMEQHVGRQELFAVDASAPAPGTYSIQSTLGQGPAASIRSRIDTRDVHAGGAAPGSYDAYQSSLSQTGAASMAGTARSELFQVNHDTADVGAYEIASSIGTGPAASIRSRIEQRDVHAGGAAPGSYEAYQSSLSQTGAASMAGTARSELFHVNTDTADVGAYDIKSTIGQGPAASIRSRISQKDVHAGGVGVGQYDGAYASTLDSHGAVGMEQHVGRQELFAVDASAPAPGTYSIQSTLGQGPAASIRSRIDTRDVHAGGAAVGDYDGAYSSTLTSSGYTMHSSAHSSHTSFQVTSTTPSPAAYSLPSTVGQGPAISMHARHADALSVGSTQHLTPAPGAYDIKYANPVLERDFTFGAITRPSANLRQFMDGGSAARAVHQQQQQQAWDGAGREGGQEGGLKEEVGGVRGGGGSWGRAVGGVARVREQSTADVESEYISGPGLLDD